MNAADEKPKNLDRPRMPWHRRHAVALKGIGVFFGATLLIFLANIATISGYTVRDFVPGKESDQSITSSDTTDESNVGNWGPQRSVYSLASGGAPFPAYNCIIDNPNYGDERVFATIKEADSNEYTSRLEVRDGTEYQIRIMVNNCGPDGDIAAKSSWIQDARAKVLFSSGFKETPFQKSHVATAYLSGSNVKEVYSRMTLWNDDPFRITYIPGSAVLCSNAHPCPPATADSCPGTLPCPGLKMSSDLLTQQGFRLGYEKMNGEIRPGYQFVNYLHINIGVEF